MSYGAMHNRLSARRGSASQYPCQHCGGPAQDWAYQPSEAEECDQRGRYSRRYEDYVPLCKSCHGRFDKSVITHCPQGHPYSGHNLIMDRGHRVCRACRRARQNRRRATPEGKKRRQEEVQRRRETLGHW